MVELISLLFTIGKGSLIPLKLTEVVAILLFSTRTIIFQWCGRTCGGVDTLFRQLKLTLRCQDYSEVGSPIQESEMQWVEVK